MDTGDVVLDALLTEWHLTADYADEIRRTYTYQRLKLEHERRDPWTQIKSSRPRRWLTTHTATAAATLLTKWRTVPRCTFLSAGLQCTQPLDHTDPYHRFDTNDVGYTDARRYRARVPR
jgi:hypothetical protein